MLYFWLSIKTTYRMRSLCSGRLLTYALIVALPLWFGSCKKDGGDPVTPASIEGTWKIVASQIDPGVDLGNGKKETDLLAIYRQQFQDFFGTPAVGNLIIGCLVNTPVTFKSGGMIVSKEDATCSAASSSGIDIRAFGDQATWKLDGNKLTITDGSDVTIYDVALSGNTLKLTSKATEDFDNKGPKSYNETIEMTRI